MLQELKKFRAGKRRGVFADGGKCMEYTVVDMEKYPRKAHFDYFRSLVYPYMGTTVNVDVTELADACKKSGHSFYLAFMHIAALAADGVEELRYRIKDGGIVCYESCCTSHVEALPNGTYCYCTLRHDMGWKNFFDYAERCRRLCRTDGSIEEDGDVNNYYFISALPWFSYTALIQPAACADESNPRITWGKYERDYNGRLMMPLTVLAHHALADGMHLARFYANVESGMKKAAADIITLLS